MEFGTFWPLSAEFFLEIKTDTVVEIHQQNNARSQHGNTST